MLCLIVLKQSNVTSLTKTLPRLPIALGLQFRLHTSASEVLHGPSYRPLQPHLVSPSALTGIVSGVFFQFPECIQVFAASGLRHLFFLFLKLLLDPTFHVTYILIVQVSDLTFLFQRILYRLLI